jgi:hypothetical protein
LLLVVKIIQLAQLARSALCAPLRGEGVLRTPFKFPGIPP